MNNKTVLASAICMGCITGLGIISENELAKTVGVGLGCFGAGISVAKIIEDDIKRRGIIDEENR